VKYIDELRAHGAELWTQDPGAAQRFGLNWIRGVGEAGLGRKAVHFGGNSGFQAINLAYLWGAQRIVMLGFDMQVGPKGASHWFGDHPENKGFGNPKVFDSWIKHLKILARDLNDQGIDVFNCTRTTSVTSFVRCRIADLP